MITNVTVNQIADALNIAKSENTKAEKTSFGDVFEQALKEVNQYQKESTEMKNKLMIGEVDNIHDTMIAAEKADITMQFALKVYGKVMEAYKEIMRLQV